MTDRCVQSATNSRPKRYHFLVNYGFKHHAKTSMHLSKVQQNRGTTMKSIMLHHLIQYLNMLNKNEDASHTTGVAQETVEAAPFTLHETEQNYPLWPGTTHAVPNDFICTPEMQQIYKRSNAGKLREY